MIVADTHSVSCMRNSRDILVQVYATSYDLFVVFVFVFVVAVAWGGGGDHARVATIADGVERCSRQAGSRALTKLTDGRVSGD